MSRRRAVAWIVVVTLAVCAASALTTETVFRADSDSMSPTIEVGDVLVAARHRGGGPGRGDVVVFTDPGGWGERVAGLLGREDTPSTFVKRVIGLPGERVACCTAGGALTVDGEPLAEDYREAGDELASVLAFDRTVPAGSVFVLGDARAASIDSRYLGSVPITSLIGTLQFVVPLGG
ncbi:signal peptidase I [Agromyces fucosus]|uniref:Signal peptidase I n=1 Tax=Agromyces fucosus TaxID=41985 RepID=A0A4Q2JSA0_9MICO|nr:signal peptidase I [Agromyces fucosus]RXZ49160.1 signal peptidase I [Agromyces fucosus]